LGEKSTVQKFLPRGKKALKRSFKGQRRESVTREVGAAHPAVGPSHHQRTCFPALRTLHCPWSLQSVGVMGQLCQEQVGRKKG